MLNENIRHKPHGHVVRQTVWFFPVSEIRCGRSPEADGQVYMMSQWTSVAPFTNMV